MKRANCYGAMPREHQATCKEIRHHPSRPTRGAEPATLTAERHLMLVAAARADHAYKALFEPATAKVALELRAHERRQRGALLTHMCVKPRRVVLDYAVEHGVLGLVARVPILRAGNAGTRTPACECVRRCHAWPPDPDVGQRIPSFHRFRRWATRPAEVDRRRRGGSSVLRPAVLDGADTFAAGPTLTVLRTKLARRGGRKPGK